jgi:hypothetical protein
MKAAAIFALFFLLANAKTATAWSQNLPDIFRGSGVVLPQLPQVPRAPDDNEEGRRRGQSQTDPRCNQLTDTQKQQTPGCH